MQNVDAAAKKGGKVGIISVGWDPGMFSLNRLYASAVPAGRQRIIHSGEKASARDIPMRYGGLTGVKDAKQYTIPVEAALEAVQRR